MLWIFFGTRAFWMAGRVDFGVFGRTLGPSQRPAQPEPTTDVVLTKPMGPSNSMLPRPHSQSEYSSSFKANAYTMPLHQVTLYESIGQQAYHIWIFSPISVCTHIYICIQIDVHVHIYMHGYLSICNIICVYTCMHTSFVFICGHTHTPTMHTCCETVFHSLLSHEPAQRAQ